jgi:pimeloyl-ACP methyl ester carboxylesterase
MKTKILTEGRYPVRYTNTGHGLTLVFLHGYLESLEIWNELTSAFPAGYRIITLDLPGHGKTGTPGAVSSMEEMAATVVRVLDHQDVMKCFIIGHSMGGYAALALLEHYPERLMGFSLFHSHTHADTPAVVEKRQREIRVVEQGHKHLLVTQNIPNMFASETLPLFRKELRFLQRIARNTPDEGITAAIRGMMARPDRTSVLENASVPCLQIIGRHDNYIPFQEVAMEMKLPPGSERLILEHSGHVGFLEEKARAFTGILGFLKNF